MLKILSAAVAVLLLVAHAASAQVTVSIANAGTTGTTNASLAKLTGAPSTAVISATSDTVDSIVGVVVSGAGTTGNALIAVSGIASCTFDASGVVANHWVINSTATGGDCADGGVMSGIPPAQAVGIALATVGSGAANMIVAPTRPAFAAFLAQANTFTGSQAFAEIHRTSYGPTLTSNNYNAVVGDCGKILLLPTGTTPTLTLPNISPASGECVIAVVETTSAQYTPGAAAGGTLTANVNGFTKTKGTGAFAVFVLTTPSVSAAVWMWSGDGA